MSNLIKTETREIEIKGHKIETIVTIEVEEDWDTKVEDDYSSGDAEQDAAYFKRFKSGNDLFIANVIVVAKALGEMGADFLGAVHMPVNNMYRSKFDADLDETIKSHDMIENALAELADNIVRQASKLKPFAD